MASEEQLEFNEPHRPHQNAIDAFTLVLPTIKSQIIASRRDWDKHESCMWSRAAGITDARLTDFEPQSHLTLVRSAATSYGTIILGKIQIPAVHDKEGEGFVHVRIHDPPNKGIGDVTFHSILTDEGNKDADGHPTTWRAIQTLDTPLEFFNE